MHLKKRTFCVGRSWILWWRRHRLKTTKSLVCLNQGADGPLGAPMSTNGQQWEAVTVQGTEVPPTAGKGKICPWDPPQPPPKHVALLTAGLQYVTLELRFRPTELLGEIMRFEVPGLSTCLFFLFFYLLLPSLLILSSIPLLSHFLFYFVEMDSPSSGWPQTH